MTPAVRDFMSPDEPSCLRVIYSGRNMASHTLSYCWISMGPCYIKKTLPCLTSISTCSLSSAGIDFFEWKGSPFFWLPHSFWHRCFGCSRTQSRLCFCFCLWPLPSVSRIQVVGPAQVLQLVFLNSAVNACARKLQVLVMREVYNCMPW